MTMSNVLLLSVLWQLNAYFDSKNKLALIAAIIGGSWWYFKQQELEKENIRKANVASYVEILKKHGVFCGTEYAKENLQFWHDLQNYSHFAPEQTLFIDDSESVLKTAANFGIKHILSIKHPDSQTVQHRQSQFPMLEHFKDILPIA